jgi:hypothetical protein
LQTSVGPKQITSLRGISRKKLLATADAGGVPEIYRLDDVANDDAWIKFKSAPPVPSVICAWAEPEYDDILIVGTNRGPFWSTDGGATYTQGSYYPRPPSFTTVFAMDYLPHSTSRPNAGLLLGTDNGVFYLTDNIPRPGLIRGLVRNLSVFYDTDSSRWWFWPFSILLSLLSAYLIGVTAIVILALGGGGVILGSSWLLGLASRGLEVIPRIGRWALFLRYKYRLGKLADVEKAGQDYFGLTAKLSDGSISAADSTGAVLHSFVGTYLQSNKALVLTGTAGAGKSTILARLTWLFLRSNLPEIKDINYVILVPASFYKGDFFQAISNTLRDRDGVPLDPGSSFIRQQMEAGGFLVLFDGLSEIETERSAAIVEIMSKISDEKMKGCRFIFTSRPIRQLPDAIPSMELQPLTIEDIKNIYLPCYPSLMPDRKKQVLLQLQFFRNKPVEPLLFSMAIQDSLDETLSATRAELFEKYFRRVLNVHQKEKETIWLGWKKALESLADWFMLSTGKRGVGLPHKLLLEKMLGIEKGMPIRPKLAEQLSEIYGLAVKNNLDLVEQLGSVGIIKGRQTWSFRLDAFEEYFAASRIISAINDGESISFEPWKKNDEDFLGTVQFLGEMAGPTVQQRLATLDLPKTWIQQLSPTPAGPAPKL